MNIENNIGGGGGGEQGVGRKIITLIRIVVLIMMILFPILRIYEIYCKL